MPQRKLIFVSCLVALMTSSFGFIVRAFLLSEWGVLFNLSETQIGALQGAGLFPFALSIILFSLFIDRLGYGRTMAFAWASHVVSAVLTMTATSYTQLYLATFLFSLANGALEAAINPVTATLFPQEKTKYLNMLHAGWPGGLVLGGIFAIALGSAPWQLKVGLFLVPALVYGFLLLRCQFPVQERVAAGVSYADMLREFGWGGCLIVAFFCAEAVDEVARVFGTTLSPVLLAALTVLPTAAFAWRVRAFGRPMFIFLLLVMILLATTELGVDSWIAALMTPVLRGLGANAGNWLLVYTSLLMFILRFCAGPLVHRLSPPGLLIVCSLMAAVGLFALSASTAALAVLLAATLYGAGKTFFWPTTMGVVAEQFPRGGALTLNAISGMGMIAVGVLGAPLLGTWQDSSLDVAIRRAEPALHAAVAAPSQQKFGFTFQPLDKTRLATLPAPAQARLEHLRAENNQATLRRVALLPVGMALCFTGLALYFHRRGGYRPVVLTVPA